MNNEPRLVESSIFISFSKNSQENRDIFKKEYTKMSEIDDDPVGTWLKMATARGDTKNSDKVVLTMITELHRKLNIILDKLENRDRPKLKLDISCDIGFIGFGYFKLKSPHLQAKSRYYARVDMPTFPKREIPLYFEAVDNSLAKILLMHDRDLKDWDAYVVARERVLIREAKKRDKSV